jgi:hypothetical protein
MEQYDLLLTQNTGATGVEFTEKRVKLTHASLLTGSSASGNDPKALTATVDDIGKVLKVIDSGTGGAKLAFETHQSHSQNTDEGTTNERFYIGGHASDEATEKRGAYLKRISDGTSPVQLDVLNRDNAFLKVKGSRFYVTDDTKSPQVANELTSKEYVDNLLAANDAMVFKGIMQQDGTITSNDSNVNGKTLAQLTSYSAGWTIKFGGTGLSIADVGILEPGDFIICIDDYVDAYSATHWKIIQANLVGAVTKSGDLVENSLVVGAGSAQIKNKAIAAQSVVGTQATANAPDAITATDGTVLLKTASANLQFSQILNAHVHNDAEIAVTKLAGTAFSVAGKATTGNGALASIVATNDTVLTKEGSGDLGFGKLKNAQIDDEARIALSKLGYSSADGFSVLGKATTGSGPFVEIKAAADDTVLMRGDVMGIGTMVFSKIENKHIDNAAGIELTKLADMATASLIYRKEAGSGAPEVNSLATLKTDLGSMPVDWKVAPADKIGTGYSGTAVAGWVAKDANFIYVCDTGGAAGSQAWSRLPRATNWS